MEMADIQSIEKWQELATQIEKVSPLRASIYDTKGIRIADGQGAANKLCPEIKATSKGQAFICAVAHMNLATIASNTRKPVVEECDAGMIKIVVPVFFKEEYIGAIGGCGLLAEDGEVDTFMIFKTTEIPEEKIAPLAEDIGRITPQKIDEVTDFIQSRLKEILSH